MSRAYNVIDADGHILEPLDLWAKYMDPKFRDRAPRLVTDNATGKEKLLVEQQMLGSEQGMGGIGGVGGGPGRDWRGRRAPGPDQGRRDEIRGRPPRRLRPA